MSNYDELSLYLVENGEVSDATPDTPWDGENSVLVAATSEESALDLASSYNSREIDVGNLVWNGQTIAVLHSRDSETGNFL